MPDEKKTPSPAAPEYLSDDAKKRWLGRYQNALADAKKNMPNEDPGKQIAAALREANKMLSVPAPETHADAAGLEDWQVVKRETKPVKGVNTLHVVTIDGRKYKFPVPA